MSAHASLARPRADADIEPGLTLADMLDRTHVGSNVFPLALRVALADEVERGRVVLDDAGRYRLVPDAFDGATLAALRSLVL